MLKILMEALKELSLSDKYILGVSLAILINPTVALVAATLVLTYFIYRFGKKLVAATDIKKD